MMECAYPNVWTITKTTIENFISSLGIPIFPYSEYGFDSFYISSIEESRTSSETSFWKIIDPDLEIVTECETTPEKTGELYTPSTFDNNSQKSNV